MDETAQRTIDDRIDDRIEDRVDDRIEAVHDLQSLLNQNVHRALAPATAAIAIILSLFVVAGTVLFNLPEYEFLPVLIFDCVVAAVMIIAWLLLRTGQLPLRYSQLVGVALALITQINILGTLWFVKHPNHTMYLAIVMIGAGAVLLSKRLIVVVIIVSIAGWAVTATQFFNDPSFGFFPPLLITSAFMAIVVHKSRLQNMMRIHELRRNDIQNQFRLAQALENSEGRYRLIVETANEGIGIVDENGIIVYTNPRINEMFGYQGDELVGRRYINIVHPDDHESVAATTRQQRDTGRDHYERRFLHSDGSFVWCRVNASPLFEGDDCFIGTVGLLTDISAEKQALLSLTRSEKHHRTVFEGVFDSIMLFDPETEVIFDVNRHACTTYGFSRDEFVGKSLRTITKNIDRGLEHIERALNHQGPYHFETVQYRKDGTELLLDIRASVVEFEGQTALLSVNREITEQRLLEKQIRAERQRLGAIIEHLPEGVLVLDRDARVLFTNSNGETHLSLLAGKKPGDQLTDIGGASLEQLLEAGTRNQWVSISTESETPLHFEVTSTRLGSSGDPGDFIVVLRDVTRDRQVQEHMMTQQRLAAVGQLASGIAHDFNNILQIILMNSEMIRSSIDVSTQHAEQINSIIQQTKRASSLVRQILDFSRISVVDSRPLNISKIASETIELLRRTINERVQLSLNIKSDNEEFVVRADPAQIQQVITNLVLNSQDAMREGGEVTITLDASEVKEGHAPPLPGMLLGHWIVLTVKDNGIGIPSGIKARVFEPFFSTKEPGKGTGLGLAQVYGIVKQHNGFIDFSSAVGHGTSFNIYLPRIHDPQDDSDTGAHPVIRRGNNEIVVVVEDEESLMTIIASALTTFGFDVYATDDTDDAIRICEKLGYRVDVVLSDVVMPKLSGPEFLQKIRPFCAKARFILMSGYPLDEHLDDRISLEFELINKPFTMQKLVETVIEALS